MEHPIRRSDDPTLRGMLGWSNQRRYLPMQGTPLYRVVSLLRGVRQKLELIRASRHPELVEGPRGEAAV
jgi:hypothetical protein